MITLGALVKVLVINPGSTSTKTALYTEVGELVRFSLAHELGSLAHFPAIMDQLEYRKEAVLGAYRDVDAFSTRTLSAVAGRGGLLRPLSGGVYRVNSAMKADLRSARFGNHASNLGGLIADRIAREAGVEAFIVDPIVVDELSPLARFSGIPEIPRRSIFHALNQRATAGKAARQLGLIYEACNLIVAHLGGGISIAIHEQGRVTDVNNALDGEGPFSVERAGSVPAGEWMRYVLNHADDQVTLQRKLSGRGGLVAYLGSNDVRLIERAVDAYQAGEDDPAGLDGRRCLEVLQALCYQVSKEICSLAAVTRGKIDALVLTGGLSYSDRVVELIRERVSFLAPILIFPGENELEALATAVIDVLQGKREIKEY